jgi:hypothetical protein
MLYQDFSRFKELDFLVEPYKCLVMEVVEFYFLEHKVECDSILFFLFEYILNIVICL